MLFYQDEATHNRDNVRFSGVVEQFPNDCWKTKTKAIAESNKCKQKLIITIFIQPRAHGIHGQSGLLVFTNQLGAKVKPIMSVTWKWTKQN